MPGEQETPGTRPDPSVLTSEAIEQTRLRLRDYLAAQMEILATRLDGMDEATKVLHETVTRTPTDIDQAIRHLKELHAEKFDSVKEQFAGRDEAVKAAFAAQEKQAQAQDAGNQKAIDKSEKNTLETIKQTDGQIDDLKERVGKIENIKLGAGESRSNIYAFAGFVVAMVLIVNVLAANGVFTR